MKRILLLAFVLVMSLILGSCEKPSVELNYATPDPAIVKVDIGETSSIKVNGKFSDGSTKDITSDCEFIIYSGNEFFLLKNNTVTGIARGGGVISIDYDNKIVSNVAIHVGI